jgi:hypothetical protein
MKSKQTVNISRSKKLCVENKDKANRNSLSRSFSQKLELQQNNDIKKPINEKSNSELTMWDMLELVKVNKFPKKEIKIGDSITSYTAQYYIFSRLATNLKQYPKTNYLSNAKDAITLCTRFSENLQV